MAGSEAATARLDPDGRFSRFELISWWDQQRLSRARVLVIGAGALGNEIVKNLALVGVGNILLVDLDRVENSNLSRSVLFRAADNGRFKAEVAADAARRIYPEARVQPLVGNAVYDLGWGAYFWADVIIGGLDNREARVGINAGAMFAGKPWVDGAIEVLDGVARVFRPGAGPCYECTMSDADWAALQQRRSCALLTREEMAAGRVPTTPTSSSLIAAVQVQETVKLLHGQETLSGQGFVYSGRQSEAYLVSYPRKADCLAHDSCRELECLPERAASITVGALRERAARRLGGDPVLDLPRDILAALECPRCQRRQETYVSLGKISEAAARCPDCGEPRAPELLGSLEPGSPLESRSLAAIGVPPFDVVSARRGEETVSYLLAGDAPEVLGPLRAGDYRPGPQAGQGGEE